MFGADKGNVENTDNRMNGKKLKIGIVQARFNAEITDALAQACKAELWLSFVLQLRRLRNQSKARRW